MLHQSARRLVSSVGKASILQRAVAFHRGTNVYHSKRDCVAVLRLMEEEANKERIAAGSTSSGGGDGSFSWWTPECSAFVDAVEAAPASSRCGHRSKKTKATIVDEEHPTFPLVVVEGLDGVGKTTVVGALVERLGGFLLRTPDPSLEPLRARFRVLDEPLARAFYCGANYVAASHVDALLSKQPVIMDRWWCSTCAMSLATVCKSPEALPLPGSAVYRWPEDLPYFDVGALLHVDEAIRRKRMQKRNDENAEEALLAAELGMRNAAMTVYDRFGLLHRVDVPNYMMAVNQILFLASTRGFAVPKAAWFSESEMATVKPY